MHNTCIYDLKALFEETINHLLLG